MRVNRPLDEYLQMRKMQRENLIKVLPFLRFANEFFLHSDLVKGKELREYFKSYSDNIKSITSSIQSALEFHITHEFLMKERRERRRIDKQKQEPTDKQKQEALQKALAEILRIVTKDKTKQEVEEVEDIDIPF